MTYAWKPFQVYKFTSDNQIRSQNTVRQEQNTFNKNIACDKIDKNDRKLRICYSISAQSIYVFRRHDVIMKRKFVDKKFVEQFT
jgi:hypothetical protein